MTVGSSKTAFVARLPGVKSNELRTIAGATDSPFAALAAGAARADITVPGIAGGQSVQTEDAMHIGIAAVPDSVILGYVPPHEVDWDAVIL